MYLKNNEKRDVTNVCVWIFILFSVVVIRLIQNIHNTTTNSD